MRFCCLCLVLLLSACAGADPSPVAVRIFAINDFHGYLQPPSGGIVVADPQHPGKTMQVPAGGAEHMATLIRQSAARSPNHIFVAAGDLVGASPMLSALFHDEPTIQSLDLMGLEISAVGNHEFDDGWPELRRKQYGGCHPVDGCRGGPSFAGARFSYLAASTWDVARNETILPAYRIKTFQGVPVAFVGLTLRGTPGMVMPAAVRGLRFDDEAETVNRLVPSLQAQGVRAIVLLIHEGGAPVGDYNECQGLSGAIMDIVRQLDPAVRVVISGHTHRAYNCQLDGRLITSGDKYGTIVTHIDMDLDPVGGQIIQARADNVLVRTDVYAKDPDQTALIARYQALAGPLIDQVVGSVGADFTAESPSGAFATGQLVADAQLAATMAPSQGGAQIAMVNRGGVRTALRRTGTGAVTLGQAFAVLPFGNQLVTVTLTGADLHRILERQWLDQPKFRPLQVSRGFSYAWDARAPVGRRVDPASITLNGQPVDPVGQYRVTVNNFLYMGGDGFAPFAQGRDPMMGGVDYQSLADYLTAHPGIMPDALDRVRMLP